MVWGVWGPAENGLGWLGVWGPGENGLGCLGPGRKWFGVSGARAKMARGVLGARPKMVASQNRAGARSEMILGGWGPDGL